MGIAPLENTIAFGGVATGSINAQEALIVAGIISINGSIPKPPAVAARIGKNMVAIAVLDVISVRNVTTREVTTTITTRGAPEIRDIVFAIDSAR